MGCVVRLCGRVDNIVIVVDFVFIVIVIARTKAEARHAGDGADDRHARVDIHSHTTPLLLLMPLLLKLVLFVSWLLLL